MLGIDERALRVVWTVFLFALILTIIYFIRDTLLVFALAIVLAYMLSPLVIVVERFIPKRRNLALAVVYCILIGILVLCGFLIIPRVAEEATNLAQRLPSLLSAHRLQTIPLPSWLEPVRERVISLFDSEASQLGSRVLPFVQAVGSKVLTGIGAVLPLILIPILAFFFLKDGENFRKAFLGSVDEATSEALWRKFWPTFTWFSKITSERCVVMSISRVHLLDHFPDGYALSV